MNKLVVTAVSVAMLGGAGLALAHSGATGIVKERMEAMKSVGAEMKVIAGMLQGKVGFDAGRLEKAAMVINSHAVKIEHLFPKGSDHKPTRALPEVWSDKVEFDKLGKELAMAAQVLAGKAKVAKSAGEVKMEIITVGKNCKACHKKFRAPE